MNPSALIEEIASKLTKANWQLVTAESCTGGLIASQLTERAGSSVWFERGFVTYSNLAKQEMLAVSQSDLQQFGAVSEEVALAMALGALKHSKGQLALSVTGIAGPSGGTKAKPVGTVCFAWASLDGNVQQSKNHFEGTRAAIRQAACFEALKGVLALLNKIQHIPH